MDIRTATDSEIIMWLMAVASGKDASTNGPIPIFIPSKLGPAFALSLHGVARYGSPKAYPPDGYAGHYWDFESALKILRKMSPTTNGD